MKIQFSLSTNHAKNVSCVIVPYHETEPDKASGNEVLLDGKFTGGEQFFVSVGKLLSNLAGVCTAVARGGWLLGTGWILVTKMSIALTSLGAEGSGGGAVASSGILLDFKVFFQALWRCRRSCFILGGLWFLWRRFNCATIITIQVLAVEKSYRIDQYFKQTNYLPTVDFHPCKLLLHGVSFISLSPVVHYLQQQ